MIRTLLLVLLPLAGAAQNTMSMADRERPPFTLKIVPLELLPAFQQTIAVRTDIPLASRWGLELGAGYIMTSWGQARFRDETYQGVKLRAGLKYYYKRGIYKDSYLNLAFKYNDAHNEHYVNTSRQGGQYTEWLLQGRQVTTWGAGLRIGKQIYFGRNNRWVFDRFLGFGIRQDTFTDENLPADAVLIAENRLFNFRRAQGAYTMFDFMLGFSLGWIIGEGK